MEATNEIVPLSSEAVSLAKRYYEVRQQKAVLDKQVEDLKAERDMIAQQLQKIMEEIGMSKFNLKEIGTFYLQATFYPLVTGDPVKVIEWLDGQGHGSIAPRTISKPAFKELYQQLVDGDKPLPPPDLVEAHTEVGVRLRATKS
jgi:hypothetical protein